MTSKILPVKTSDTKSHLRMQSWKLQSSTSRSEYFLPVDVFYRLRKVIYLVMDYYRYQILKMILDHGIKLDVFGGFWKNSVFTDYPNLICHSGYGKFESCRCR